MSKVEKLELKYPLVIKGTFTKFVNSDTTPTKKYLEYMLKMWSTKSKSIGSIQSLIEQVRKFDELLPYIPLKDIYHFEYTNFEFLKAMNEKAEEIKEEKSFVREEHCDIIIENDKYFMVRPRTHKGSLKYGNNTKWCTASKHNESTFTRYFQNGYLVYLIDKTNEIPGNFGKIALYFDYVKSPLSGEFTFYDASDKETDELKLVKNGWEEIELVKITNTFRYYFLKNQEFRKSLDYVNKFKQSVEKLNVDELIENIKVVDNTYDLTFLDNIKNTINNFNNNFTTKLKNYGNR
jgi:hypothetical protein